MSTQPANNYWGLTYDRNRKTTEVHRVADLTANCQLDEIKDGVRSIPDRLTEAHRQGYDNCHWCIGRSTR